jgi:hypothetical protein
LSTPAAPSVPKALNGAVARQRLVLALCVLGAVLSALWCRGLRHEDAFVAFRYARNIASGAGFVFNPGERVLSTASPLLTMLLAAAYPLFHDRIADLVVVISGAALGVQAFVIYRMLRDALPVTSMVVAVLVFAGLAHPNHFFALETNLALALGLSAIEAFRSGKARWCGWLLGLSLLARYEAFLLVIPLLGLARGNASRLLRPAGIAAAIWLPWLAFATFYFGSPLPHAWGGKFGLTPLFSCAKAFFAEALELPGLEAVPKALRLPPAFVALGLSLCFLFRRAQAVFWLGIYGLAVLALFAVLGPPKGQTWYVYPGFLLLRVCLIAGICGWVELRPWPKPLRFAPIAASAAYALYLLTLLQSFSHELRVEYWLNVRQARYETVARYALEHFGRGQTLLSTEVASLGYLTDYRVIDPYGLITPSNAWPRSRNAADYAELVTRYRPSLILFDSPEAAAELQTLAPQLRYRVVKVFDWGKPWSTLATRID